VEASTLQAPAVRALNGRASIGSPLLRLRSDEQLVALFRAGHDEAFRAIHDRYRQRLFAYARQMLPRRQDAEDALQEVFVRAYAGLRANDRELALRAWLYRVAHNRCVDELRRPPVPPAEVFELITSPVQDPVAQAEQRESLRRLIADVRRLPGQQRSALLMRELSGMPYAEMATVLGVSVPAVKSLLVRARIALAQAMEARDTACCEIRSELILAHDRRVRPNAMARRHMRDCAGCREFRHGLRGVSRQLAALAPAAGPLGIIAKLLGFGVGGGAGGSAAAGGTTAVAGTAAGTGGALASAGALATGAGHVATLLVATVVTAGGAVEIQHTITATHHQRATRSAPARHLQGAQPAPPTVPAGYSSVPTQSATLAAASSATLAAASSAAVGAAERRPAASGPAAASPRPGKASGSRSSGGKATSVAGGTGAKVVDSTAASSGAPSISSTAVGETKTGATSSTAGDSNTANPSGSSPSTTSNPVATPAAASPASAGAAQGTSSGSAGSTPAATPGPSGAGTGGDGAPTPTHQ
jgi:RNA polymerase sigma factor (sigma-70 family)